MTPHRIVVVALIVLALTLLARAQTTPSPELATRLDEAIRLLEAGRASDARPKLDAVIADARSADDKVTEGHALGRLGRALQVLGDHAGARARFDDAERVLTEVGDPYTLGLLLNARAHVLPEDVQAVLPAVALHRLPQVEQPASHDDAARQLLQAVALPA